MQKNLFTPLKPLNSSTLDEKITCKDYYIPSSIYTLFLYHDEDI